MTVIPPRDDRHTSCPPGAGASASFPAGFAPRTQSLDLLRKETAVDLLYEEVEKLHKMTSAQALVAFFTRIQIAPQNRWLRFLLWESDVEGSTEPYSHKRWGLPRS